MLALHVGCGQLRLITHDEVGALCWLSTALGHCRVSELQDDRPGYSRLLDYLGIWQNSYADSRQLLGMGEVKDMKQWVTHAL